MRVDQELNSTFISFYEKHPVHQEHTKTMKQFHFHCHVRGKKDLT
jgi:hypothetical protein